MLKRVEQSYRPLRPKITNTLERHKEYFPLMHVKFVNFISRHGFCACFQRFNKLLYLLVFTIFQSFGHKELKKLAFIRCVTQMIVRIRTQRDEMKLHA